MKINGWRFGLVAALFLVAVLVTSLFTIRVVRHASRLRARVDEPVQAWMSVPYIARSHRVPPSLLFQAIGVQPGPPPDRRPIREIARAQGRPVEELISQLNEAIRHARQGSPIATPGMPLEQGPTP
ncbi:MAG TPA: hypothetical protein VFZ40_00020 [Pyrinomonadaceae bacterium]